MRAKKRLLSFLLCASMLLSVSPQTIFAVEDSGKTIGDPSADYAGEPSAASMAESEYTNGFSTDGEGQIHLEPAAWNEEKKLYEIGNAGQLYWFSAMVNGTPQRTLGSVTYVADFDQQDSSANAVLTADITDNVNVLGDNWTLNDAAGLRTWTPIGCGESAKYTGTFDGAGYTVSGLYIPSDYVDGAGLFDRITYGSAVKNVHLRDCYFDATATNSKSEGFAGGIVGRVVDGQNRTIIEGCSFVGVITTESNNNGEINQAGGICGVLDKGTISQCWSEGKVTGRCDVGGIVGQAYNNNVIENCYSGMDIKTLRDGASIGGIIGYAKHGENSYIRQCTYHDGELIESTRVNRGGLIGYIDDSGLTIVNSYFAETEKNKDRYTVGNNATMNPDAKRPADDFASGKIAWLLNGKVNDGSGVWQQHLTCEHSHTNYPDFDACPVYGGYYFCSDKQMRYTNSSEGRQDTVPDHKYENGFCTEVEGETHVQPAPLSGNIYQISNPGQLMWFSMLVNGDRTAVDNNKTYRAEFTAKNQNAEAILTADIDYTAIKIYPIGSESSHYQGVFDGNGKTVNLNRGYAGSKSKGSLFECIDNATIKNLTTEGNVFADAYSTDGNSDGYRGAGGIVSSVYGTTRIEQCISRVSFNCPSNWSINKDFGGIAGRVCSGAVLTVENCAFLGYFGFRAYWCSGGMVGWTYRDAQITFNNCYVKCTAHPYASNFAAFYRSDNLSTVTVNNCYYEPIKGMGGNTGAVAKSAEQFASGEVAGLLNGGKADGVWKQCLDCDGITSGTHDKMPYPLFTGDIVYCRSDESYSNLTEVITVDITWEDMEFTYTDGTWNPETHEYDGAQWVSETNGVTVENKGNVAVKAQFSFAANNDFAQYNIVGSFDRGGEPTRIEKGGSLTGKMSLTSLLPRSLTAEKREIGTVTVSITHAGGDQ